MPIYEYRCDHCDMHFELMQKVSDPAATKCPTCHQETIKKLISSTSFQLKGTGWYVTDFRNKDTPPKKTDNKEANKNKDSSEKKE